MIKDIKLKPVVLGKFMDFLTSKCTDEERVEIEKLLSGSRPTEFGEAKTVVDPETFTTITIEEYKEKFKKNFENSKENYINVHIYFHDKYRNFNYGDSIDFKIKALNSKDRDAYRSFMQRPFENCVEFCGVSKDFIDSLSEEKKAFLSNFAVIEVSMWHYECYDIVIYYNTKDKDGDYYINDMSFIVHNN